MVRALAALLATFAAACNGGPEVAPLAPPPPQARIAPDLMLTLPVPPGYPETRTGVQIVRSRHLGVEVAVEAVLALGPEETVIILTVPGGPRLATITWDRDGVRAERAPFAPEAAPVENVLSDIFFTRWPAESITASLPAGVEFSVEGDARMLRRDGEIILEAAPDVSDPKRLVVRNHALGYEITITTQSQE